MCNTTCHGDGIWWNAETQFVLTNAKPPTSKKYIRAIHPKIKDLSTAIGAKMERKFDCKDDRRNNWMFKQYTYRDLIPMTPNMMNLVCHVEFHGIPKLVAGGGKEQTPWQAPYMLGVECYRKMLKANELNNKKGKGTKKSLAYPMYPCTTAMAVPALWLNEPFSGSFWNYFLNGGEADLLSREELVEYCYNMKPFGNPGCLENQGTNLKCFANGLDVFRLANDYYTSPESAKPITLESLIGHPLYWTYSLNMDGIYTASEGVVCYYDVSKPEGERVTEEEELFRMRYDQYGPYKLYVICYICYMLYVICYMLYMLYMLCMLYVICCICYVLYVVSVYPRKM